MATGAALRCVLVASVVLGACATGAGQPLAGPRDASDRLAGTRYGWALSARGAGSAQCREEWSFGADGIMTIQSGRETTTKRYTLEVIEGVSMLALDTTRVTTNGLPDCMGERDATTGQVRRIYLQFLNGGGFFTCGSTDSLSCIGVASPH